MKKEEGKPQSESELEDLISSRISEIADDHAIARVVIKTETSAHSFHGYREKVYLLGRLECGKRKVESLTLPSTRDRNREVLSFATAMVEFFSTLKLPEYRIVVTQWLG